MSGRISSSSPQERSATPASTLVADESPHPSQGVVTELETATQDLTALPARLPRHIAIIMDGNGRWARARGLPRVEGHRRGADTVRTIVEECSRLGLEQLTLYCFSSENWKRPEAELQLLMELFEQYLVQERPELQRQNVRLSIIGRRTGLSAAVLREMDISLDETAKNTGLTLCLAVNYGSRGELVDAMQLLAKRVARGELRPEDICEETISHALYTAGMPDPDLVIRTAGELRVSNYLLWQISYAELWVTERCWPDFDAAHLHTAIHDYSRRKRRFGGLQS